MTHPGLRGPVPRDAGVAGLSALFGEFDDAGHEHLGLRYPACAIGVGEDEAVAGALGAAGERQFGGDEPALVGEPAFGDRDPPGAGRAFAAEGVAGTGNSISVRMRPLFFKARGILLA